MDSVQILRLAVELLTLAKEARAEGIITNDLCQRILDQVMARTGVTP